MGRLVALRVDLEHDAPELLRGDWVVVVDQETGELSATRRLPFAALAEVVRLVQSGAALPLDPPAAGGNSKSGAASPNSRWTRSNRAFAWVAWSVAATGPPSVARRSRAIRRSMMADRIRSTAEMDEDSVTSATSIRGAGCPR